MNELCWIIFVDMCLFEIIFSFTPDYCLFYKTVFVEYGVLINLITCTQPHILCFEFCCCDMGLCDAEE